jgi:AcrR family transcriptional regulator
MSQTTRTGPGDPRVARSRAAVLDAGIELLVEGGPNAVTVEAVSQRSGVAKTTIYRQWSSRNDLVVDVVREVVGPTPIAPPDVPFEEALRTMMRASCDSARGDRLRRAFPALLLAKVQDQIELDELRSKTEHDQEAQLADLLRRGVAEGRLGPDVTLEDAQLQLIGPMLLLTCGFLEGDPGVADRIVDLFLASHRPDPG